MAAKAIFLDTNVLVYATQVGRGGTSTSQHGAAERALQRLQRSGARLWVSRQVLREYLAVVTRPQGQSPALPMHEAVTDVRRFVSLFALAEDGPGTTDRLLDLLQRFPSAGRQVHDANIVATMLSHGLQRLLTFNTTDFVRFASVIDLEPV
jgi:predicted nucleic acid-binding protein